MSRRGRFQGKPFGGNVGAQNDTGGVSDQLLKNARKSGQLNLSSRGLAEGRLSPQEAYHYHQSLLRMVLPEENSRKTYCGWLWQCSKLSLFLI